MSTKTPVFTREATGLVRQLGFLDQFIIALGTMNITGGFVLTMVALPFFFPGANAIWVFVLGSIPAFAFVIEYGILSAAMPRSGGDYVWTGRILGPRWAAVMAILFLFSQIVAFTALNAWAFVYLSLAPMLLSWGITTGNAGLAAMGATVVQPVWGFAISFVFLVFQIIVGLLGMDAYRKVNRLAFIMFAITAALFMIAFPMIGQSGFQASFDKSMSSYNLTYASVVSSISTNPQFTGFNLWNTLLAFPLLGFLTYSGFNFGSYAAGETKNVSDTIPKALFSSVVVLLICLVVLAAETYNVLGQNFVGGISYLFNTGALGSLPVQPTISFLVSLGVPPWLGIPVNLTVGLGVFLVALQTVVMFSRIIFAMSFDRIIPSKFADVNERFHSPHNAILITGIVAIIFESLYWFQGPGLLAGYLNTGMAVDVAYIIPGFAALLLPVLKKDMYKKMVKGLPGWLSREIAGVPMISIGGLGVVLIWAFGIFTLVFPVSTYFYLGSSMGLAIIYTVGPAILGLAIYEGARAYHKRKDAIDINLVFAEIPPE